jgi:hypothetical protein
MNIVKTLKKVVILTPADLHSPLSQEDLLLEKLRRALIGRVEGSCFITDILSIESSGSPRILTETEDGSAQVSVTFRATAVVIEARTPMVGRLAAVSFKGLILRASTDGKAENVVISVPETPSQELDLNKIGLMLPVMIMGASYDQLSQTVKAQAVFKDFYGADPVAPQTGARARYSIYQCSAPLSDVDCEQLRLRLEEARALPPLGELGRKIGLTLHPHRTQLRGKDLLAHVEEVLASHPAPASTILYARPALLNLMLPEVCLLHTVPKRAGISLSTRLRGEVLSEFLSHYMAFHRFGLALEREYAERMEEHAPLWRLFENKKTPLPAGHPF